MVVMQDAGDYDSLDDNSGNDDCGGATLMGMMMVEGKQMRSDDGDDCDGDGNGDADGDGDDDC